MDLSGFYGYVVRWILEMGVVELDLDRFEIHFLGTGGFFDEVDFVGKN